MSKAIIIFADGSKQMAHNLDDSRFRWHERKLTTYDEVQNAFPEGVAFREWVEPTSIREATEYRTELRRQDASLNSMILILRAELFHISPMQYEKEGLILKLARSEISTRIGQIDDLVKAMERSVANRRDEQARATTFQNMEAQRLRAEAEKEKTEQLRLKAEMTGAISSEERLAIARMREERLAKTQESQEREFIAKLKGDQLKLNEKIVNLQEEVIRLQNLLIEQFNVERSVVIKNGAA